MSSSSPGHTFPESSSWKAKIHNTYKPWCPQTDSQPCLLDMTIGQMESLFIPIWLRSDSQSRNRMPRCRRIIETWNEWKDKKLLPSHIPEVMVILIEHVIPTGTTRTAVRPNDTVYVKATTSSPGGPPNALAKDIHNCARNRYSYIDGRSSDFGRVL